MSDLELQFYQHASAYEFIDIVNVAFLVLIIAESLWDLAARVGEM